MTAFDDEAFRELGQIAAALTELPEGDPARAALVKRRQQLRAAARRRQLAERDPRDLTSELAHLRKRRADLEAEKVQIPKWQELTGGRLTDPEAAGSLINKRLDEVNAAEVDAIESRIADLAHVLGEDRPPQDQ